MAKKPTNPRRRKPRHDAAEPTDFPFAMKLPDGRTLLVEVPGRWVTTDRDGSPALEPEAVEFLDRVQVSFQSVLRRTMTPAYLATLRKTLGMTQKAFGEAAGVDSMTVSRWERGEFKPSAAALAAIEKVRQAALRRGVAIPG